MKKLIALAIAIVMMAALAVPAFAVDPTITTSGNTASSIVNFTIGQSFTVTIPESINIDSNSKTGTGTISATGNLPNAKELQVTVSSGDYTTDGNKWMLVATTSASVKVEYTITNDEDVAVVNNGVVLEMANNVTSAQEVLDFEVTGDLVLADSYSDTLTFTASLADVT